MGMKVASLLSNCTTELEPGEFVLCETPSGTIEISISRDRPDRVRITVVRSTSPRICVYPVASNVIEVEPFQK